MSNTIVVISDSGRLVDVTGADRESDGRYIKFVSRLLGDDGTQAVINYGWDGRAKLKITGANGVRGLQITLDAQEVIVPGDLKINGVSINALIHDDVDTAIDGITGTADEIDVTTTDNPHAGDPGEPRKICTIKLASSFVDRLSLLEEQVAALFRFDQVYYAGDGLETRHEERRNTINAKIGLGLKFNSSRAIAVDCDTGINQGSQKPASSGAVFNAIEGAKQRFFVATNPVTDNMEMYDTRD